MMENARGPRTVLAAIILGSLACRAGSTPAPAASGISPPSVSIRVEADRVSAEGRWFPLAAGLASAATPNAVHLVCRRPERSCVEELTRPSNYPGGDPVKDSFRYRVDEWTPWGQPVGKLVGSRQEGGVRTEIRISLSGLAAEKAVIDKRGETSWRLE